MGPDTYAQRGVSWNKKDIQVVVRHNKSSFCQYVEQSDKIFALHSDGAGSKAIIAYLIWKQTEDISSFQNILWDAVIMNTDDLLCIGSTGPFFASCTLATNPFHVPAEIIQELIRYQQTIQETFAQWGIDLTFLGGETAELSDQIRTLSVDISLSTSFPKEHLILTKNITPGMKIIGLGSFGQTSYETVENSGISSNGLTNARHDLLSHAYAPYTETFEPKVPTHLTYRGQFSLFDALPQSTLSIGQALLSKTRTYLPVMKHIFQEHRNHIFGIIHCTGGGQTKCLRFSQGIHYIKNDLFPFPPIFQQLLTTHSLHQIFSVFNCGHRLELYVRDDPSLIDSILHTAKQYCLPAKVIGLTEAAHSANNSLSIVYQGQSISYAL